MRLERDQIFLSASDLMRFQGCEHAIALDLRYLRGEHLTPVESGADVKLLQAKGDAHEEAYLESLRSKGHSIDSVEKDGMPFDQAVQRTSRFLREGPDYIYQGAFSHGAWGGYSDFLERVDHPSRLGPFSYEVIDTKLKRSPDPKHVLQLALYSELLAEQQGHLPEFVHIVLGDGHRASVRLKSYLAYTRRARDRLETFIAEPWPTRPNPVSENRVGFRPATRLSFDPQDGGHDPRERWRRRRPLGWSSSLKGLE